MSEAALDGLRVVVTRASSSGSRLSQLLRDQGAVPIEVPVLRFREAPPEELDAALHACVGADLCIVTSRTTVRVLEAAYARAGRPALPPIAAIGKGTSEALVQRLGVAPTYLPARAVAESLVESLRELNLSGARVVFPRAAEARELLVSALRAEGATVDVRAVYRSELNPDAASDLQAALEAGVDLFTVASSRTAEFLFELADAVDATDAVRRAPFASIGPITTSTLERLGVSVVAAAVNPGLESLVASIRDWA